MEGNYVEVGENLEIKLSGVAYIWKLQVNNSLYIVCTNYVWNLVSRNFKFRFLLSHCTFNINA